MKRFSIIGIFVVVVITFGFTSGGTTKYRAIDTMTVPTIAKTLPSGADTHSAAQHEQAIQGNSIFSWSTVTLLSIAVIGIVAFRRNTST
jgi:hypothetical protein